MKITAYKDSSGIIWDNKLDCEIADLEYELKINDESALKTIIEAGKKAQRLKKLYESRESRTDNK